jgi:Na+/serine symporter
MFHASFDMQAPVYTATLSESRIQATVSFVRVFAWLAINLLVTIAGILVFLLALSHITEESKEEHKDMKNVLQDMHDLGLF